MILSENTVSITSLVFEGNIALEGIAIGNSTKHQRNLRITECTDVQALQVMPYRGISSVGSEIMGQFYDEVNHVDRITIV